jgi:CheY-like chemotaxis protein
MKTILLVDDEFSLLENLTEMLEDEGYRIVSASNGRDGLACAQTEKPDLIITDFMMPIADGRDLVRELRSLPEARSIPVMMMSATVKDVALADGDGRLDVAAFIRKPFQWKRLLDTVVRLIGPGEKGEGGT